MSMGPDERQWELFKYQLKKLWNLDLNMYKQERLRRRVESWMQRHSIADFSNLAVLLRQQPALLQSLQDALFINTSEFFRDEAVFQEIGDRLLPDLLRRFGRLSIWSAACSFGAEPYTVAMLLREKSPREGHLILGTDLDTDALREAEQGIFPRRYLEKLPPTLQKRYFRFRNGEAEIVEEVRRIVTFRRHNLLTDDPPGRFHLILCRNVLIYFTQEAQKEVVQRLAGALYPGGYLVIGGTESVPGADAYGLRRDVHPIFQKAVPVEKAG